MTKIEKTNEELLRELEILRLENEALKAKYSKDTETHCGHKNTSIDSTLMKLSPEDEKTIRQLYDDYIRMYATRDDLLTTHFSENFSGFTGGGDFLVKDKAEWIAITRQDFSQVKDPLHIEHKDLSIQLLADTIAVTTGFFTIHLPINDHILSRETARLVLIFRNESGIWKISHSSISIPYYLVREEEVYPLKELKERNQLLEDLVAERTIQLSMSNDNLQMINIELAKEIEERKQAEESELNIKKQYDSLVSKIPVGIYQMLSNSEGNLTLSYVSPRAAKMFNAKIEDLLGNPLIAFQSVHPDDMDKLRELNIEGFKNQRPFNWEGRVVIEGVIKWLHIISSPEPLESGDVLWHGLVVDITERKQAQELMLESEQKYRLLVNSANEAIVVIQGETLQLANPMAITMTGYSEEEITTTPLPLFIHPEDRDIVITNHQKRLNGEDVPGYYVFRLLNKDGRTRWVHMNAVLINWNGKPASLNFFTDITELKTAEKALQQTSQKWEAVISTSPDGIGMISLDGKIQLISDKIMKMHGYPPDAKQDFLGTSIFDYIDPSSHKLLMDNTRKLLAGETEHRITEYLALKKDKSQFHIDVNASVLYDTDGNPTNILYVERDITERKSVEKELLQKNLELAELNATKDKFFSIIAHDLKSPFQGLIGYSHILATEYSTLSEEEKLSFINSIENLSHSSYKLLENLLEWSRMQTGQMVLHLENFNLFMGIYPTLSLVKQTARNKGIEFTYIIDNSFFVKADKNMLNTIVRNLVSNAIKFTNPKGKIMLSTEIINGFIEISVADTGIGIEKRIIDNLFVVEKSTSKKGTANEEGTGIGLLLCKEMIEKNGGTIQVKSEPGKGSTFSFTIQAL